VITPSYNQGEFIEETILSVLNQDHGDVEHIVVDGGSSDGTVEILKRYPHLKWVSERDGGQADALNKGLAMATGEIIGWLNSDDCYRENVLASVAGYFDDPATGWVIGNVATLFDDGTCLMERSRPVSYQSLVDDPDIVRQQPAFFRRELLERAGRWNAGFYMVMDYDLWLRLSKISPPVMTDQHWAFFRNHAAQKSSHANILRQSREIAGILRRERASLLRIARLCAGRRWFWLKGAVKERLIGLGLVPERYRLRPVRLHGK
jgi:glycosyltransferase involved in cell wall biosynthesis